MLLLFCVITMVAKVASEGCHFGYEVDHGAEWGHDYDQCSGKHQSPINIDSKHVTHRKLPPFKMNNFDVTASASLINNGHTAMMTIDTGKKPTISGGPLGSAIYEFLQLHFHWGDSNCRGAENEINGKDYPIEMHAVFYKQEYSNFDSALLHQDGLTVLGCLFEIGKEDNENYEELVNTLWEVTQPNAVTNIDNPPELYELMPRHLSSYFTYNGSLTTPPCTESVIWIEFDHTVKISSDQLESFRNLINAEGEPLVNNFRAVQPLGDRVVIYCKGDSDDSSTLKKLRRFAEKAAKKALELYEFLTCSIW